MDYVSWAVTGILGQTNYTTINQVNLFNFCIVVFEGLLIPEEKVKFVNNMKLHVGMEFTKSLKGYIFRKNSKHEILEYL